MFKWVIGLVKNFRHIQIYILSIGCWCLPAGAGFDKQGFGLPVDNIDKSCREFTTCYNCLYNPAPFQGENCNEMEAMQKRYNIQGTNNRKWKISDRKLIDRFI